MYPPLSSVILYSVIKTSKVLNTSFFNGLKFSLFFFLLASSLIFLALSKNILLASLFHLAFTLNSTALVYIDIFIVPFILIAFWFLRKRKYFPFTIFYMISILIKWQPIIIAPFILIYILDVENFTHLKSINYKKILKQIIIPVLIIFFIFSIIFGRELVFSFTRALNEDMLSGTALNLGWIITYILELTNPQKYGSLTNGEIHFLFIKNWKITLIPSLLFIVSYLIILFKFFKNKKTFKKFLFYSILGLLSYFVFNKGVHENHLFLASVLGLMLLLLDKKYFSLSIILVLMDNINLLVFYGINGTSLPFSRVVGIDVTIIFSFLNLIFFSILFIQYCLKGKAKNLSINIKQN